MNMIFERKLPVPKEVKEQFPVTEELNKIKTERDNQIKDIFEGKSDKLITPTNRVQRATDTRVCYISLTLMKTPIC